MIMLEPTLETDKYKNLLLDVGHELRNINRIIKSSSEVLTRAIEGEKIDRQALECHIERVFDNAYLTSLWLDVINYETNPDFFIQEEKIPRNIHAKFYKAARCFKCLCREKSIKINKLSGEVTTNILTFQVIDILPYLIYDNCVKYSPNSGQVETEFVELNDSIDITVSSIGPSLEEDEINHVFMKGFRGKNARKLKVTGSGRGLNFLKFICDIHNADIKIKSAKEKIEYNNVPYSEFTYNIRFQKNFA